MSCYTTHSPGETALLGEKLAHQLKGGEVVAFTGGLGAGKTTFCTGLAKGLGCTDAVSSPTFAIANYYRGPVPLAHFDAYRIHGEEDLETAGFYDYLAVGAVVAIEWSENVSQYLPTKHIHIDFKILSETEREICMEGAEDF